jgi:hypothetical protein
VWRSFEIRLQEGVFAKDAESLLARKYSGVDRDNIADKLIELAQKLLR